MAVGQQHHGPHHQHGPGQPGPESPPGTEDISQIFHEFSLFFMTFMNFRGFDLEFRGPAGIPGTLQLSVLVPVLLNAPRRTQEEVAGGDLSRFAAVS